MTLTVYTIHGSP